MYQLTMPHTFFFSYKNSLTVNVCSQTFKFIFVFNIEIGKQIISIFFLRFLWEPFTYLNIGKVHSVEIG